MSLQKAHKHRNEILKKIATGIATALRDKAKNEPQLVANLVWHLPNVINTQVNQYFNAVGVDVRAGGVFVHSQPLVKCDSFPSKTPASVEIGDLLLLMTYKRLNGTISRNALLLQAKKIANTPEDPGSPNQHYLYAYWPEFEYAKAMGTLNGVKRRVVGPHLYNGAKYLLIVKDQCFAPCFCNWPVHGFPCSEITAMPSIPHLSGYQCFVCELYDFLFGNAGREFIYQPPSSNIGWDQVITDIMDITANNVSNYMRKASSTSGKRGVTCFITGEIAEILNGRLSEFSAEHTNFDSNDPPEVSAKDMDDDKNGEGVSTIELTVTEFEPER